MVILTQRPEPPAGVREEVQRLLKILDVEFGKVEALRAKFTAGSERDQISALLLPIERGIEDVETAARARANLSL